MKGFAALFLLVVTTVYANSGRPDQWYANVEEAVSRLAIGPLRPDFRPLDLARRTRESALAAQVNTFRAKVIAHMLDALGTIVRVCPYDNTSKEAVDVIVNELQNRTFTASWVPTEGACGHHRGMLLVIVPLPI